MRTGTELALETSMGDQWCGVSNNQTGHEQEMGNFKALTRIAMKNRNVGALIVHLKNQ